ncbi:MAG TPA: FlgD immunoglobulin-like domain containing protein [Candidatus Krumholzibacteria bacterium]|nr:FlgD immunoglobulin-like domain containing protein [Candidatus Krumholzibacteria bacterium]HRX51512.1 FlgD immunoglobulin-like domain containing protein [Candidatus Krumholzibacteria bacterium]
MRATILTLALALLTAAPAAAAYEHTWWSVDGGGGASTSASYAIHDVIGQPDAGVVFSAVYRLTGGLLGGYAVGTGVDDGVEPGLPRVLRFHAAAPNPFNPTVMFRVDLPDARRLSAQVLDLRGRVVRTLVDEERPAGRHDLIWHGRDADGREAASGVYLVRIRAGDEESRQRVTLVR